MRTGLRESRKQNREPIQQMKEEISEDLAYHTVRSWLTHAHEQNHNKGQSPELASLRRREEEDSRKSSVDDDPNDGRPEASVQARDSIGREGFLAVQNEDDDAKAHDQRELRERREREGN